MTQGKRPAGQGAGFKEDQWVEVEGLNRVGRIRKIDRQGGRAEVLIGGLSWDVELRRLRPCEPPPPSSTEETLRIGIGATGAIEHEIDLHGLDVEEAEKRVAKFLDSAILNRLPSARIIHGHGKGKLREAVRRCLAGHPHVRAFHFAHPSQGGTAVTVVHLADQA